MNQFSLKNKLGKYLIVIKGFPYPTKGLTYLTYP